MVDAESPSEIDDYLLLLHDSLHSYRNLKDTVKNATHSAVQQLNDYLTKMTQIADGFRGAAHGKLRADLHGLEKRLHTLRDRAAQICLNIDDCTHHENELKALIHVIEERISACIFSHTEPLKIKIYQTIEHVESTWHLVQTVGIDLQNCGLALSGVGRITKLSEKMALLNHELPSLINSYVQQITKNICALQSALSKCSDVNALAITTDAANIIANIEQYIEMKLNELD